MDSKKIGAFIAMNRKKKGLTQEQLGEKLGVTNKTISRWENGNYMPDLSMLVPLSRELDITVNELLAGEPIREEESAACAEKNLISTIDYSVKKMKKEHKKISVGIAAVGILLCIFSFIVFAPESSWGEICSILGILIALVGVFRELNCRLFLKAAVCAGLFFLTLGIFMAADFVSVSEFRHPPRYRYAAATYFSDTKIIEYRNLFYHVFRINADTPNEYYIIDTGKKYDIDTVPVSPFNRDKSGIEQLIRYQNSYVGNNSNTGNLFYALPLSEYGFVFEIDSQNCGVTIDYHTTDWYGNENLYMEKGMVYNAVSAFALIENLEYIRFHFSGSGYVITRESIEENYPEYHQVVTEQGIDQEKFDRYVEKKMNDEAFVAEMFQLFERE